MKELFTQPIIPEFTMSEMFRNADGIGLSMSPQSVGQTIVSPNMVGGVMDGVSYRSNSNGARLEIFPEWDPTIAQVVYNAAGTQTFKIEIDGDNTGDITIGDYANDNGLLWDNSAGIFYIKGAITLTNTISSSDISDVDAYATDQDKQKFSTLNVDTPTGTGLFLDATHLGYYDTNAWKTYMDSSGNFYLGGSSGALQWNGTTLSITGVITVSATSSGIGSFSDAGDLATTNEEDANVLNMTNAPAEAGADVTASNEAATIAGQGDLATLSTISTTECDTTIIDGGKIITGLLTATNIQTGTLSALPYQSAGSGARVLIFPDANTGIQIIDDAAADVFKVLVGGTDVGDVIIGNYAGGQGMKYDKSAGKIYYKNLAWSEVVDDDTNKPDDNADVTGDNEADISLANLGEKSFSSLTAGTITSKAVTLAVAAGTGDSKIQAGKTDFGQDATAGFIFGIDDSDDDTPKFEIGSSAAKVLKYDGTDFTLIGGVITGGTVRTAASGARAQLDNTNFLQTYDSNGLRVKITTEKIECYDTNGTKQLEIDADFALTSGRVSASVDDLILHAVNTIKIDSDNDSDAAGNFQVFPKSRFYNDIIQTYDLFPSDTGVRDLGDSTLYYGEINYKTLTDRGCLGWFDDGVKMRDGTIVSDLEAIKLIKKHPTKKTIYGVPMLDYKTMPEAVYRQATKRIKDDKGNVTSVELLPRGENDEPYNNIPDLTLDEKGKVTKGKMRRVMAADGAETTALISIMLGAIKELSIKIERLTEK